MWLRGEVSNLRQPASGHQYFSLKDEKAQVTCAFFRQHALRSRAKLRDGMQVQLRGKVSLFEQRGDYQIIVETVEDDGEGRMRQAYQALREKLQAMGLFDEERKQPIPRFPKHIAVVTSASGAALQDFLTVLRRRYPIVRVTVVDAVVQGDTAPESLINGLQRAETVYPDVICLTRGGGSLEDLWAFNDEALAHAIGACKTPVVTAVGHEIDWTIADEVADVRAPTPTAAAEIMVPDKLELSQQFDTTQMRLESAYQRRARSYHDQLRALLRVISGFHPEKQLADLDKRLRKAAQDLRLRLQQTLTRREQDVSRSHQRLNANTPVKLLNRQTALVEDRHGRLVQAMRHRLQASNSQVGSCARTLHAVSPLAVLDRGYSVTKTVEDGGVIGSVSQAKPDMQIETQLKDGTLQSTITAISPYDS